MLLGTDFTSSYSSENEPDRPDLVADGGHLVGHPDPKLGVGLGHLQKPFEIDIADAIATELKMRLAAVRRPGDRTLAQDRGRFRARKLAESGHFFFEFFALAPEEAAASRCLRDSRGWIAHEVGQLACP